MITNRSAPTAIVVPILVYDDVSRAIDWLCAAFGFTVRLRHVAGDGTVSHAQLVPAPPVNMPFGERQYSALDPEGHRWTFSQHVADKAPEEWGAITH